MLIVDTTFDQHVVRRTSTWLDLIAAALAEDHCDHDRGRCLLDPPTWTYWIIGGHPRYSLGGLLWHTGQAVFRRLSSLPIAD